MAAAGAAAAALQPGDKQNYFDDQQLQPSERKRFAPLASSGYFNAENLCKWRALHQLHTSDGYKNAVLAARWDSAAIAPAIKEKLDDDWAAEQARIARAQQEEKQEAARIKAQQERNKQRRAEVKPIKEFTQAHNLSIVHAKSKPAEKDELALKNPLSLQYENRPTKTREEKEPSPSPSPDPELTEEAAALGIALVSANKAKRAKVGAAAAKATELLNALPAETAAAVAAKFSKAAPALPKSTPMEKQPKKAAAAAAAETAAQKREAIQKYYEKKLKAINNQRVKDGHGKMNKAGRATLKNLCQYHYQQPLERGFEHTGLVQRWDIQFVSDLAKYPDAEEGDTDSDAEYE